MAGANYFFCSAAKGEQSPINDLEKTTTTRDDVTKALTKSFDYCDEAYRIVDASTKRQIDFMGKPRSPAGVLTFRNYHSLLHYGNVITYMRIKGKVPPSSQLPEVSELRATTGKDVARTYRLGLKHPSAGK